MGDITKVEVGNPKEFEEFMTEQDRKDEEAKEREEDTMWRGSQIP